MAEIDHQAELTRAGANVSGHWSRLVFYMRQHPLGAIGAAIVVVFVLSRRCSPTPWRRTIRCTPPHRIP